MAADLKKLIGKLNKTCHRALEEAAGLCVSQTHYNVEVEHFLTKLLEIPDTDFRQIIRYYEIEVAEVTGALTKSMESFQRGNSRTPAISPQVVKLLEESWVGSSLHLDSQTVRSGTIVLSLLDNDSLLGITMEACPPLLRIPREQLRTSLRDLVQGSREAGQGAEPSAAARAAISSGAAPSVDGAPDTALAKFTIDLTAEARAGKIDPIVGRDREVRQIIDILLRRRQNNPILTGEAGVGKTAVVEGFAQRVASGDVPPALTNVSVRTLDLGLLQAGAGIKGEFEERLKKVITEVKASATPIILFIDEAHTLIGAGGMPGQSDAANLLKPALARGELRTIAATTWSEYKKYFEKDPALARRFQVVKIEEPPEEIAIEMLRGLAAKLETHHNVRLLDEAICEAVRLSHRYLTGRYLPDKAISVLDTACARVAVAQNSTPPAVEDATRYVEQLATELRLLEREQASGHNHYERIVGLKEKLETIRRRREELTDRWEKERGIVARVLELRRQLEEALAAQTDVEPADSEPASSPNEVDWIRHSLEREQQGLEDLQGENPMVPICVDAQTVASVLSGWTGIPVGKMLTDEISTVMTLKERLQQWVIGQEHALGRIAQSIQTSRANLEDPDKPVGVFLLVGPSGIGKTETAIALAEILYGGHMVRINMSEYQEAHTVSKLKGAPAGYVGYGSGGVLTEAVRRNPYTVVLLDEVEKAHPDVLEMFYQVFDKGIMEDAEGTEIDFKNAVILLTSNHGTEILMEIQRTGRAHVDPEEVFSEVRNELLDEFPAAFLGRLVVVPYYPLDDDHIRRIVHLKLRKIQDRFEENHHARLTFDDVLVATIAERCTEVDSGARNIDHILSHSLLPELSAEVLERMASGERFGEAHVAVGSDGFFSYRIS